MQPWDTSQLGAIEKAITGANLGVNPSNDGKIIRVPVPALNEERRLGMSLPKISAYLESQPYRAEVVVVENGSNDDTVGVVQRFAGLQDERLLHGEHDLIGFDGDLRLDRRCARMGAV